MSSLEVQFPSELLQLWQESQLMQPPTNPLTLTASTEQGDDLQLSLSQDGKHVKIFFTAVCGSVLRRCQELWHCNIISVTVEEPEQETHNTSLHTAVTQVHSLAVVDQTSCDGDRALSNMNNPDSSKAHSRKTAKHLAKCTAKYKNKSGVKESRSRQSTKPLTEQDSKTEVCIEDSQTEVCTEDSQTEVCTEDSVKSARANKKFSCELCGQVYKYANSLTKHLHDRHAQEPDVHRVLQDLRELCRLQSKPRGTQVLCPLCGEKIFGFRGLTHLSNKHSEHKDLDNIMTDLRQTLKLAKNERRNKPHTSSNKHHCQCGKVFHSNSGFKVHVKYKCQRNPNRKELFYCNVCGGSHFSKEASEKHKLLHQQNKTNYVCDLCGKVYATRCGLLQHSRRDHNIAKVNPIKYKNCHICGKCFFGAQNLHRHMSKHTDEVKEQCDMCGKGFKLRQHLQKHVHTVHQNKYPYYCQKCGHGVDKKKYLQTHVCGRVRRRQVSGPIIIYSDDPNTTLQQADAPSQDLLVGMLPPTGHTEHIATTTNSTWWYSSSSPS